jgi:hypothetical protein
VRGQTAILAANRLPPQRAVTQAHTSADAKPLAARLPETRKPGQAAKPSAGLGGRHEVLAAWVRNQRVFMSPIAPEARDCFQVGPGLPPKWPYRRMPDDSDPFKLGECRAVFKAVFSMAGSRAIAAIGLTGAVHWGQQTKRTCDLSLISPTILLLRSRADRRCAGPLDFTICNERPRPIRFQASGIRLPTPEPLPSSLLISEHEWPQSAPVGDV